MSEESIAKLDLSASNEHSPQAWALLFDIDGTLIDTQGAGGTALLAALSAEFGVGHPQGVVLHGRTDAGIMTELLWLNGIEPSPTNVEALSQRYLTLLPDELQRTRGRVLPGVRELLRQLKGVPHCHVGLLTGNLPTSARLKLLHFDLWDWFEFGIFGDVAEHRPQLAAHALSAVNHRHGAELVPERIILVGDTPLDIELAKAMRARCLAVTTGGFSPMQLTGACRVVDDLSATTSVLAWMFNYQMELRN